MSISHQSKQNTRKGVCRLKSPEILDLCCSLYHFLENSEIRHIHGNSFYTVFISVNTYFWVKEHRGTTFIIKTFYLRITKYYLLFARICFSFEASFRQTLFARLSSAFSGYKNDVGQKCLTCRPGSLRLPSGLRIETCEVEKRSNMFFQHDVARKYLTV